MKSKVYDLMNWPEIEGITYAEADQPGELLGGHVCRQGFLVQIFRPDAVEVTVTVLQNNKKYVCEKVDEAGYFAALIPGKKAVKYSITVEKLTGETVTYADPYMFSYRLKAQDKKKFMAGTAFNAYEHLGAHRMTIDDTEGTLFMVWAPNAERVSVVGDFNDWDGRMFQMNKDYETGIFELFIPGDETSDRYCYEMKFKDGQTVRKADPYYTGDNDPEFEYIWDDDSWKAEFGENMPLAICELSAERLTDRDCVKNVKDMGFNCVELSGITSTVDDKEGFYAGNMCVVPLVGSDRLKSVINEFHKENIAVIFDCNLAYMEHGLGSCVYYDGTHLYDVADTTLTAHPDIRCSTYDYKKPQVRTYLNSVLGYWIEQFHVDGVRLMETASMLYLDYGKEAGQWQPNMYGGKENLEAVEFIRDIRRYTDKIDRQFLITAEESSIWTMVTGKIAEGGLGIDYKWNDGWKKDFMDFYCTDPLFRKGKYDKLTYSMLYQYSENFIVEFSRDGYGWEKGLLSQAAPVSGDIGGEEREKLICEHIKNAIGYMYAYPGKKLINYDECAGIEDYVRCLNDIYMNNRALYELDGSADGFAWVDDSRVDETVLAFARMSSDNDMIVCVSNFTPVERQAYGMNVPKAGKYTDMSTGKVFKSEKSMENGQEYIIMELKPLGVHMLSYVPYTQLETEENMIIMEARMALEEARQKEITARAVEEEARQMAKEAKEARERAEKAAKEADRASAEAQKQAEQAKKKCEQIEIDAKKKLDALKRRKS